MRAKRFANLKFRRQYPINNYIVDFCCPAKKLIIELDGGGHNEDTQIKKDQARDTFFKNQGFKVLRVWNTELIDNQDGVLEKIYELVNTPPLPVPLPRGERGRFKTASEKETIALGKKLAKRLRGGEVLALRGELGAGKTTLVKGIAAGLGVKKTITSPTFLLMRVYPIRHPAIKTLIHVDCYRIKKAGEIGDLGIGEYLGKKDAVVVIEWPEKIKKLLPRQTIFITLQSKQALSRIITVRYA